MKTLSRMLLINWHYFSHTEIEFKTLNFLTGQNAAGKSTIIDALQVAMLGETRSYIFNKAANDKSERTLIGYLKGELGDDGDTGYRYLRDGDFNAYIVLEFYDTVKRTHFINGAVFDVYGDGTQKNAFFIADCRIPDNQFLNGGVPLNRTELKGLFNQISNKKFSFYDSQNVYRQHLMAKCGNIKHKFYSLFKKAVPFSPISDIESFITEYITDIKGRPNIEEMQQNLRYYKRLEKDAEAIQDRIAKLESISSTNQDYLSKKRLQLFQEAIAGFARLKSSEDKYELLLENLKANENELQTLNDSLTALSNQKADDEASRDGLIADKAESDIQKRLDAIETQIKLEEQKIKDYLTQVRETVTRIKSLVLSYVEQDDDPDSKRGNTDGLSRIIESFKTLSVETLKESTAIELNELNAHIKGWHEENQRLLFESEQKVTSLRLLIEETHKTLESLKAGIKPFPNNVINLVKALKDSGIKDVLILSEVIDVTVDRWKNAIEGYLHTQKFYLLVNEDDFVKATKLYNNQESIYDVGIIDVERLKKLQPKAREGSLASFVTTVHDGANVFINYVLGNVMACESVDDLRSHSTGITDSGMLYQNYVIRQINPERWRIPYIGRNSIRQQLEIAKANLETLTHDMLVATEKVKHLKDKCEVKPLSDHEIEIHMKRLPLIHDIKASQVMIENKITEKNSLDLTFILKLDQKINQLGKSIREADQKLMRTASQMGGLEKDIERLKIIEIPVEMDLIKQSDGFVRAEIYKQVFEEAKERFDKLIESLSADQINQNYSRSSKAAGTDKDRLKKDLDRLREEYNRVYHMSHDTVSENILAFEQALVVLKDTKLPDYVDKIKDARDKTSEQFRDEFLAKLKENFDTVFAQIKELNVAIKDSPFGTDNYRFEVKPKAEMRIYYDMIMDDLLLRDGMSIMSYAFNQKHHEAIEELFRLIVDVGDEVSSERRALLEKNIAYYTDYRSYLNFDLVVKDQNGDEQRLSKTLLKKSGGETQTPFYISVLASFAHMYRIAHSGTSSETLRLIVFDEAFSKMDQQRIEESLKLLRKFKLQAIISAPPDKIVDITPHVDQNLCVFRTDNISFVKAFEKKELLEVND